MFLSRVHFVTWLVAALWGGLATAAAAQSVEPDDEAVLTALNEGYVRSVWKSDVAWFDQMLAADFRNTNPDGTIVDRAGFLAQIARPSNLQSLTCDQVEIRVFEDTAVIHARTVYTTSDGRPGTGRYTDIWVKQGGRWLAVAAHVTRLVR